MRSRPQKQIEQEEEDSSQDVAVEVKDDGPSIASNKKNTFIIIIASVVLIIICYFIFFSGTDDNQKIIEPVVQPVENIATGSADEAEEIAPSETGKSIFDLAEIDKKEKSENLDLLEKQAKPEIPEIPELPSDITSEVIDIEKIKDSEKIDNNKDAQSKDDEKSPTDPANPLDPSKPLDPNNSTANSKLFAKNSEELKIKDQKIQELENQLKELSENSLKEKQLIEEQYQKKENDLKKTFIKEEITAKQKQEVLQQEQEDMIDPRYSPIVVFTGGDKSSPSNSVGLERNIISLNGDEIKKIKETKNEIEVEMIKDRSRTIAQGKMLTAILETAINTEFPGAVRGIITRDVYGESGKEVLIPRGSRLYGGYSSEVKRGQARVLISWSRLLRPDGVSISIGLTAADQFGRAGIPGEIDNRYTSMVANSLLTSVLAVAGTAAAQRVISGGSNTQTSTTVNANQGTTTTLGNAGNQALYDVTKTIVDIVSTILKNTIDLNPVIRIPQGTRMTVIVNSDIVIPKIRGQ
jgi:type IV secretory pathway VirB10-like protein